MNTINEFEHGDDNANRRYMFDPSDFYIHEVLRFNTQHSSKRDKVATFNEAEDFWTQDAFLTNCHPKTHTNEKSREGRKLKIAEYHKRMQHKPL